MLTRPWQSAQFTPNRVSGPARGAGDVLALPYPHQVFSGLGDAIRFQVGPNSIAQRVVQETLVLQHFCDGTLSGPIPARKANDKLLGSHLGRPRCTRLQSAGSRPQFSADRFLSHEDPLSQGTARRGTGIRQKMSHGICDSARLPPNVSEGEGAGRHFTQSPLRLVRFLLQALGVKQRSETENPQMDFHPNRSPHAVLLSPPPRPPPDGVTPTVFWCLRGAGSP